MEKILKNKKLLVGAISIVALIGGMLVGCNAKKETIKVNPEKIEGLIDAEYSVEVAEDGENNIDFAITGNLDEAQIDELSKELSKICKGYNKKSITASVFKDEGSKKEYSFYTEGLLNEIKIDYEVGKTYVSKFTEVPAVEKSKKLVDFNEGKITSAKDGNVAINLNMDFKNVKSTPDKVAQLKSFVEMFKSVNKDKEIKNVIIQVNESTEGISLSTEFEKIIKETKNSVI